MLSSSLGIAAESVKSAAELYYPPFSNANAYGQADGFSVELMRESIIAMGQEVSFQVGSWNSIRTKLEEGTLEALPLVGRSPQREQFFDFSNPYLRLYGAIFIHEDGPKLKNINDIKNLRIGVMQGDNAEEYMRGKNLTDKLILYPNYKIAFLDLASGHIDAVIVQRLVGLNLTKKLNLKNIRVALSPLKDFRQDFCFAVTEGNKKLLSELNEGLSIVVANGTYDRLYDKWLGILKEEQEQALQFWQKTSFIIFVLLLVSLTLYLYHLRRAYQKIKKSQDEYGKLNRHFLAVLENTTDFLYFKDSNSRFIFCSQTLAEITHYDSWRDMIGKHDSDVFPAELAKIYHDEELQIFEQGIPLINKTDPYYDAKGEKRWVNTNKWPVFNSTNQKVIGIFGISRDITEIIHDEQALEAVNKRLTALIEALPDAIFFKDGEGRWLVTNESAKTLFNLHEIDWQGKTEQELAELRPEYKPVHDKCQNDDEIAWQQSELSFFEEYLVDKKGQQHIYDVRKIPLFSQEGKREGLVAIGRDITEFRTAIERLELAANVFTHAREGIFITNASGVIVDVNDAFLKITGYLRAEVLGQNPRILSSNQHNSKFYQEMWEALILKGYWSGEIWNRRKNGEVYAEMLTISAVNDQQGKTTHYVALFSDITEQKEQQHQLEYIAHYDALTSLPNRMLLADRLHQAMTQAKRRGQILAVIYLDLDGFKIINDDYGHDVGDRLLVSISRRLKQVIRDGDTIARIGGDEFVAVLLDLDEREAAIPMLGRLLNATAEPVEKQQFKLQVSASLGVTYYPQKEEVGADQLLRQADQAMYQAKLAGKNRYHIFDAEHDRSIRGHHKSIENIREALENKEFVLYYQPKVNMRSGQVIGVEALIRWQNPEQGLLPPAVFLPVIENDPLAVELGNWVLDTALSQLETWQAAGMEIPMSVNVAAIQLQQPDFVQQLEKLLAAHESVSPSLLELEVLETSALEDIVQISEIMHVCNKKGISFALDDFGTGYSSLTYFKRLPASTLKIDQSFIRDMLDDPEDLAILEGVLGLGAAFRRQSVAEGVETVKHGELLLQLGCELAQGYGIARPMPAEQMIPWANTWRPEPSWPDQQPVSRDDLPLLFAVVEHRAWIRAIGQCVKEEAAIPPPLDENHCRFGIWLKTEAVFRHGSKPHFQTIKRLHSQVHLLAAEILELRSSNQAQKVAEKMQNLYALRDQLLEQMQELIKECKL